ncbi:MAG: SMP-30/gluconolactonase/LRE family protein [Planctomycetes bacterium]|nr:SMP-30/gluconolactonase/LRE family protein [Planctomycetota bacterium]
MKRIAAQLLYRPDRSELRFLPEGPYDCGDGRVSWVSIQHGADASTGSLNIFDMHRGQNQNYPLAGRPGFAFPTRHPREFVVGLERNVVRLNIDSGENRTICGPVDQHTSGTIINDGVLFEDGLIFGCKDLRFEERKAGLYFWRAVDRRLFKLRTDQICSNGKKIVQRDGHAILLDIDSPTKTIVRYAFDSEQGQLGKQELVIDLRSGDGFPDGMIVTPDQRSLIVSLYNPLDPPAGETRQYCIDTGELETVWTTEAAPRATCPQFVEWQGKTRLLITTAVEHMTDEQLARQMNSGSLFLADTDWTTPIVPRVFSE